MTTTKKNVLLRLALVLIFSIAVAVLLQYTIQPNKTRWFFLTIPFFTFLANYLAFLSAVGKKSIQNFNTQISALFGIKFFSYLLFILIYFILEKEVSQRLVFIFFIFTLYIVNTIVLLKAVLNYQKSISKDNEKSK